MANGTRGVTFQLKADASGLKQGASEAKASLDQVQRSIESNAKATEAAQQRATNAAKAATSAFSAQGDALSKLLGKIDPTVAGLGKLDSQLESLKAFKASGAISGEDFSIYAGKIGLARNQLTNAGGAAHGLGLQSGAAAREVAVLAGELARGNYARFEGSLITLARVSGLLSLAFSGAGAAILGFGSVIGGAIAIYERGQTELSNFNKALLLTNNYAGTSSSQLVQQANQLGALTGQYGKAEEALTQLTASGKLSGDALASAAKGAIALSELTGDEVSKTAQEFISLAAEPAKAVVELNDKYHFLTLAVYEQIKALEEQGNTQAATDLAITTAAQHLDAARVTMEDNAGAVEKAWRAVRDTINEVIHGFQQIGSQSNAHAQDLLYAQRYGLEDKLGVISDNPFLSDQTKAEQTAGINAQIKALDGQLSKLKDVGAQQDANNRAAAADDALQQRAIASANAIDSLTSSLDKNAAKQAALNELHRQFETLIVAGDKSGRLNGVSMDANGNISGGVYDKLVTEINQKFSTHDSGGSKYNSVDGASSLQAISNYADSLAEKVGGPLAEAYQKYSDQLERADQLAEKALLTNKNVYAIIAQQNRAYDNATASLQKNITAIKLRNEANDAFVTGRQKTLDDAGKYSASLEEEITSAEARIKAGHELTETEQAELFIKQKLFDGSGKVAKGYETEADSIRKAAAELQKLHAQEKLTDDFSQIFVNASHAVAQGADAWKALGDAALPVLDDILKQLEKIISKNGEAGQSITDFKSGVDALGTSVQAVLPQIQQFAGQAAGGGGQGAAAGAAVGFAIGSTVFSAYGGAYWGPIVGGLIGGLFDHDRKYEARVSGGDAHDEQTVVGPFGNINTGQSGDNQDPNLAGKVRDFDKIIAGILPPELIDGVTEKIQAFNGTFASLDDLLAARFNAVLEAIDPVISDFVKGFSSDLQTEIQALADVFQLQKLENAGRLVTDNLSDALDLITKFGQSGERVADTYSRLVVSTVDYQQALQLMGVSFDGSKTQLVEFAQNISDAVGSTQEADALWQKFFASFYSQAEITAGNITILQSHANDSLTKIGLDATISMADFRKKFEAALPTLTPEQVAQWLQAGVALGALNDAINALISQGEDLVDKLFGGGSLSDVNSEIADLESRQKAAADAAKHLGHAVTDFAASAKAAADLLLGALSPLNDEQKLQYALTGLRRGTVTPEQVLEIGRQLYASSQAYTDLFNMVRSLGRSGTGSSGSVSRSGSSDDTKPFTADDATRLDELRARRDVLQDRERRQEANQLSTIVAQLSTTQGESFEEVAKFLGFNLEDLGKILGLNNEQLNDFLTNIQTQQTAIPDAVTANTDRTIRAMYDIAGKDLPPWATGGTDADGNNLARGHSGHARGTIQVPGAIIGGDGNTAVAETKTSAMVDAQIETNRKLDLILAEHRINTAATREVVVATRGVSTALRSPGTPPRRNARAGM